MARLFPRTRKRPGEGRTCERLYELLEEHGVRRLTLTLSLGYWSHRHQGVERWAAYGEAAAKNTWGLYEGSPVQFHSWDTVTDCARLGIDITADDRGLPGMFDVWAREKKASNK
jgi:hypothetical protein